MRPEIGSEFWNVPTGKGNDLFPCHTGWFLSGRSALQTIISQSGLQSVALPSWCCESMIEPFLNANVKISFYPVYVDETLVQDMSGVDAEGILIMDYFGYSGQVNVSGFSGTVIRDVTHSILSKTYRDADYYFGSLRKWAGFRTGGFGWGIEDKGLPKDEHYTALRKTAMEKKWQYIQGNCDQKDYLEIFAAAEAHLERCTSARADVEDVQLASKMDVEFIKTRRRKNAEMLLEAFSDIAVFSTLAKNECPLFVPILVPDGQRDALRRYLIAHEIYCPVHWPISAYHQLDDKTKKIYDDELSLVCDQRYTEKDMERLIATVKKFWKE